MAFNPIGSFSSALELFSSLYQDMAPSDLPAGLSPDNQDMYYLPGGVKTRPALNIIPGLNKEPTSNVMSVKEFQTQAGDFVSNYLYSSGNLYSGGAFLSRFSPGVQFKAENAFNKQWLAMYSAEISSAFTDNPFVGVEPPVYFDGQSVWRVTQDAPGISPNFSNVNTAQVSLAAGSSLGSLTVSGVISSDPQVVFIPPGHTIVTWRQLVYTCTGTVSPSLLGQFVAVSGLTGANSSYANISGKVVAVYGSTFTLNAGYSFLINLSGESGTATQTGNYLTRQSNIVTAYIQSIPANFFAGLYAQVLGTGGGSITQTLGTITAISRDANGNVSVTISTQLTNLSAGTVIGITGVSDSTNFPASAQTVVSVVSATGGTTIFTLSWSGAVASSSGGSVTQQWNGIFQVLSVGTDGNGNNYFTYFQLGPDIGITASGGTAQIQSQIPAGIRSAVCMFASANGAITGPSIPVQLTAVGGSSLLQPLQIPIGPPGTTQRIIAFTPAYGSFFYYITPSLIPSTNGLAPILSIGTIINDNTTTSAIVDFSDAQLEAGTRIDNFDGTNPSNDLFGQIVLAPCLGVAEYSSRLAWWGEINNIKNLLNSGFDGGYVAPAGTVSTSGTAVTWVSGPQFQSYWVNTEIAISNVLYTVIAVGSGTSLTLSASAGVQSAAGFVAYVGGLPLGWSGVGSTGGTGNLVGFGVAPAYLGFSYRMTANGGTNDCMISRSAYQDFFGAPIFLPNKLYAVRFKAFAQGTLGGNVAFNLYSPSQGSLGFAGAPVVNISSTYRWQVAYFNATLPASIPSDLIIEIYQSGVPIGTVVVIDEVEFIDTSQPVLAQQMRISYPENPFGYNQTTGVVGFDTTESLTGAVEVRGVLYPLSDRSQFITQNNGTTEPYLWNSSKFADECGNAGPNSTSKGEGVGMWAGQNGVMLFSGAPPKKISQEIQPTWETINWTVPTQVWLQNDSVERALYLGLVTGANETPNYVMYMSYRAVDAAYNVPDPFHVSLSGKLIATDLARKWSLWNIFANCGAMVSLNLGSGYKRQMVFCGGNGQAPTSGTGYGNLYYLNFSKYTDDDYGVIGQGTGNYWVTSPFWNHDTEQQTPQLGLYRKIYTFLSMFITGVGNTNITPLVDNLENDWPSLLQYELSSQLNHDLEWTPNVTGNRLFYKIQAVPLPGTTDAAFNLQHLVVAGRMDKIFPVRGAVL